MDWKLTSAKNTPLESTTEATLFTLDSSLRSWQSVDMRAERDVLITAAEYTKE